MMAGMLDEGAGDARRARVRRGRRRPSAGSFSTGATRRSVRGEPDDPLAQLREGRAAPRGRRPPAAFRDEGFRARQAAHARRARAVGRRGPAVADRVAARALFGDRPSVRLAGGRHARFRRGDHARTREGRTRGCSYAPTPRRFSSRAACPPPSEGGARERVSATGRPGPRPRQRSRFPRPLRARRGPGSTSWTGPTRRRRACGSSRPRRFEDPRAPAAPARHDPRRQLHEPPDAEPAREARLHVRRRAPVLAGRALGTFYAGAEVTSKDTGAAIKEFLAEFARLSGGDVTDDEAGKARGLVKNGAVQAFSGLSGIVATATAYVELGAPVRDPRRGPRDGGDARRRRAERGREDRDRARPRRPRPRR